jgi:hypothetical protein
VVIRHAVCIAEDCNCFARRIRFCLQIIKIASFYGVSISDTLAVCSSVAVEELSGGRVSFFGGASGSEKTFRVGRLDWVDGESPDSPKNTLPASDISNSAFAAYWARHNFTCASARGVGADRLHRIGSYPWLCAVLASGRPPAVLLCCYRDLAFTDWALSGTLELHVV